MHINWLDYKNKKTGLTIKKITFQKVNLLTSEDPTASLALLDTLTQLRNFALGIDEGRFCDAITRINFQANHQEYLWFAKNTTSQGTIYNQGNLSHGTIVLVDEEELYDQDNTMLMRRGFQEVTLSGYPTQLPNINQEKSMLYLLNTTPVLEKVVKGFGHLYSYHPQDQEKLNTLELIKTHPHGAAVIIGGENLSEPWDITPLLQLRPDIQIFATNCIGAPTTSLTLKGKAIFVSH